MLFLRLKIAQDTLVDPVKRFAYDRFGEEALRWGARESEKALSRYELVMAGLNAMVPSYVVNLIMLAGLNWFWLGGWGSYVSCFVPLKHWNLRVILIRSN